MMSGVQQETKQVFKKKKTCLQEEKRLAAGKRAEKEQWPVFPGATPTETAPPTLSDGRLKLLPLRPDLCPTSWGSTFIKLDV